MFLRVISLIICAMMLVGPVMAIDNVAGGAGAFVIMQKGFNPTFAYAVKTSIPTYTFRTSAPTSDSLISKPDPTLFAITEVSYVYSEFDVEGRGEMEAQLGVEKLRKTLGFAEMYIDFGATVWRFVSTNESNVIRTGYCTGFGIEPISGLNVDAIGHVIPITDGPDMFMTGIAVYYHF
jgi:hypothetical protein